jgi:hypothetical protein
VAVTQALLKIPAITGVKVTFSLGSKSTVCSVKPNVVSIEFTQQFGVQPPLIPVVSSALSAVGGTVQVVADGVSSLTDANGHVVTSAAGTKENSPCSNRGLCDTQEGVCSCYDTNGDAYDSSDGYGHAGTRGDCGSVQPDGSPL